MRAATTANLIGLGAARHQVLADAGWDVETAGLAGGPRVRVLAGAERHGSVDLALRYLGLGTPFAVAADDQERIRVADLARELAAGDGPTIVCLQAGNLHSGAFDPFTEAIAVAHAHGARGVLAPDRLLRGLPRRWRADGQGARDVAPTPLPSGRSSTGRSRRWVASTWS
jgi:glutamate/tyrosine decarboxylase-like PLP-dependent enzyme